MKTTPWLISLLALAGCATSPPQPLRADPELAVYREERAELRTDLREEQAGALLPKLATLEVMLDAAFPFLPAERPAPVTVVLADAARFSLYAQELKVQSGASAFVAPAGEVVYRYRSEEWDTERPLYAAEPRSRPLAAAVLRRRLVLAYGNELEQTWFEEGVAQVFSELAAHEFREDQRAVVQSRQRLLDAYLPLYLGGEPVLARMGEAVGRLEMERVGVNQALAWAAVRFLLTDPERGRLIRRVLERAAGKEGGWSETRAALASLERDFERFLLDHCVRELLATVRDAPTPVDRWEAAAALRLIANLDLDPDLPDEERRHQVEASGPLLRKHPPPVRFLDRYTAELRAIRSERSQLAAMRKLNKRVRKEFERRTQGYGHPAIEAARAELGKALQRAYRADS